MNFISKKFGVEKKNIPLLLSMGFLFLTSGGIMTIIGVLLPYISKEYGFDYAMQGNLLSVYNLGSLVAVILIAVMVGWLGRKNAFVLMFSTVVIGLILVMITNIYIVSLIAFAAIGISRGSASNIVNVTVSDISTNKVGALNFIHTAFAVGALVTPLIAMLTIKNDGWRIPTIIVSVMSFMALVLIVKSNMTNEKQKKLETKSSAVDWSFLSSLPYWTNCLILFFYIASEASVTGWFVTYFKESQNLFIRDNIAPITTSILWGMVLVGRIFATAISGKVNHNRMILVMSVLKLVFFVLMIFSQNTFVILICLAGVGFTMSSIYPTTVASTDPKYSSSTHAMGFMIAFSTFGGIIMSWLIGEVAENYGIGRGMSTNIIALGLLVAIALFKLIYEKSLSKANKLDS